MSVVEEETDNNSENNGQNSEDQNKEEEIDKAEFGNRVKATAQVKNINDGEKIEILVYEKGCELEDNYITEKWVKVEVKDSKIEFEMSAICSTDLELFEKDEKINIVFKFKEDCIISDESPPLEITFSWDYKLVIDEDAAQFKDKYTLKSDDDSYTKTKTLSSDYTMDGKDVVLNFDDIKPGHLYHFYRKTEESSEDQYIFINNTLKDLFQ